MFLKYDYIIGRCLTVNLNVWRKRVMMLKTNFQNLYPISHIDGHEMIKVPGVHICLNS